MTQENNITKLVMPIAENNFIGQWKLVGYVGVDFRPDICSFAGLIAPGNKKVQEAQIRSMEKGNSLTKETRKVRHVFSSLLLSQFEL